MTSQTKLQIELGCSRTSVSGSSGFTINPSQGSISHWISTARSYLFDDNSGSHVFTSHAFEHVQNYHMVCRRFSASAHMATVYDAGQRANPAAAASSTNILTVSSENSSRSLPMIESFFSRS